MTLYFLQVFCEGHYSKIMLLLLPSYPREFCFPSFHLFSLSQYHLLSIQHTDAEMTVLPIILITSPCLNFTGSSSCFYIPNSNPCLCMQSPLVEIPELFHFPVAIITYEASIKSCVVKRAVKLSNEIWLVHIKNTKSDTGLFFCQKYCKCQLNSSLEFSTNRIGFLPLYYYSLLNFFSYTIWSKAIYIK